MELNSLILGLAGDISMKLTCSDGSEAQNIGVIYSQSNCNCKEQKKITLNNFMTSTRMQQVPVGSGGLERLQVGES